MSRLLVYWFPHTQYAHMPPIDSVCVPIEWCEHPHWIRCARNRLRMQTKAAAAAAIDNGRRHENAGNENLAIFASFVCLYLQVYSSSLTQPCTGALTNNERNYNKQAKATFERIERVGKWQKTRLKGNECDGHRKVPKWLFCLPIYQDGGAREIERGIIILFSIFSLSCSKWRVNTHWFQADANKYRALCCIHPALHTRTHTQQPKQTMIWEVLWPSLSPSWPHLNDTRGPEYVCVCTHTIKRTVFKNNFEDSHTHSICLHRLACYKLCRRRNQRLTRTPGTYLRNVLCVLTKRFRFLRRKK